MVTMDTIRQTVFCAVGRYEAGFYQPYRKPEHEQAAAPVGQVEEGVEILFHPLFWIALEAPPVVDVNKAARRDLRTGRVAPQFGHLLLSQQLASYATSRAVFRKSALSWGNRRNPPNPKIKSIPTIPLDTIPT